MYSRDWHLLNPILAWGIPNLKHDQGVLDHISTYIVWSIYLLENFSCIKETFILSNAQEK